MGMPVKIECQHPFKKADIVPWAAVNANGVVSTGIRVNGKEMAGEDIKKLIRVLNRTLEHLEKMAAAASAHYQLPEE